MRLFVACLFLLLLVQLGRADVPSNKTTQELANENPIINSLWSAIRERLNKSPVMANTTAVTNTTITTTAAALVPTKKVQQDAQDMQEKAPGQMAPIEKAIVYLRPKADERWVLKEEGSVIWAVSSLLQSKANDILMNCNLYQDNRMLLSVFKDVPLSMGIESWTPPVFLKPGQNYKLRIWSQPSDIGIIDEYSSEFSIVPRPDDAFMFTYNRSIVMESNNSSASSPKPRIRIGQPMAGPLNSTEQQQQSGVMLGVNNPTASFSDPNLPTGIYALYPSSAWHISAMHLSSTLFVVCTMLLAQEL